MKKCKSCQTEIDENATKCPHCQADQRGWFRRHPILTVILGLIALGIVGRVVGGGKSATKTQTASTNTNVAGTTTEQQKIAEVGDSVQDGDLAFTVTNVTTAASLGNQYTSKQAQGIFNVIALKVENKGKETKIIDSSMITLIDSQGRKFDRSIEGQTAKGLSQGKVDLFLQQVQPSLNVIGDVVFDIPKDATGLKLIVKGNLLGIGQEIDLGK